MKMVKLLISIPEQMKRTLDAIKAEGYTASGYLRRLLELDLHAREEAGWVPGQGWKKKAGQKSAQR